MTQHEHPTDPVAVVQQFLGELAAQDVEAAVDLLDVDVEWRNTGFPTLRGSRVAESLRAMVRRGIGFEAVMHHVAADGDVVLTDRTDTIVVGPVRTTIRVFGTFRVRDGKVVLWHDRFSWLGAARATAGGVVRGLLPGSR